MTPVPVPVFMYHTVGITHKDWLWSYLTLDYKVFDHQMRILHKMGCNSVALSELYDYMKYGKSLPKNPFVITFDDGYADNWIAAAPIMKKYGFRGTTYVNPEFVDTRNICRPTLDDVWKGDVKEAEIDWKGFLTWPEMKEMEKQGTIEVQSHAMTHTWYFKNNKLADFQHPGDAYVWMNWNRYPDRKPAYMHEDQESLKEYGAPVYEHDKSLKIRRHFPPEEIADYMIRYVKENGGKRFFEQSDWREKLNSKFSEISAKYSNGRDETDEEYDQRLEYELAKSKEILENQLGKKVEFLCWPGGGYNETSVKKALQVYKSVTLGSHDQSDKRNIPGDDPATIKRMGIPYFGRELNGKYVDLVYPGGYTLYCYVKMFQGSRFHNLLRKILKAAGLLRIKLGIR